MLEYVSNYKYLGCMMDEHLTFKECTKLLANSAGRALGAVIAKSKLIKDLRFITQKNLIESCVDPILEYGAEALGNVKYSKIDKVILRGLRYFLGVHKFAPILGILGETGWELPNIRRKIIMLRYWNRMVSMDIDRMTKIIFDCIFEKHIGWCKEIPKMLEELDMVDNYLTKQKCNLDECKEKLNNIITEDFLSNIHQKCKLRT